MFWIGFLAVVGLISVVGLGYLDAKRAKVVNDKTVSTPLKAEDLPVDIHHYRNLFHAGK